ncbi:MAG: ATP-binding protein [Phycisphaerales bacterium]
MAKKSAKPKLRTLADEKPAAAKAQHPVPVSFSQILGQDRALKVLTDAIRSGRVHHAWIFYGPSGVGKFTTALAFAALILDDTTKVKGDQPVVGADSHVKPLLAAGSHPDLHIITKELAIYSEIDSVRKSKQATIAKDIVETHLIAPALLAASLPGGLSSKVFIIDEAELLDRHASHAPTQAAILKTLEEPPPGTVIILVTTNPDRLLTTIRSRSQQVAFAPLHDPAMREWLEAHKKAIEPPISADDLPILQSFAAGSPGELLLAHRGNLAQWSRTLEPLLDQCDNGKYSPGLGPTMAKLIDDWAGAFVENDKQASKDAANRAGAELMFRMLSQRARQQLRRNADSPDRQLSAINNIREAERQLDASVAAPFVMEWLSTRLCAAPDALLV